MSATKTSFDFAVLGAGGRGQGFAGWIKSHPEAGRIVAVAEPDEGKRKAMADGHNIAPEMQFSSWEALLAKPRLADVIINTLMDRLHAPSAIPALNLGYHMLLEKPMAVTLEDCIAIDEARKRNNRIVTVCHSLRYLAVYAEIKRLLDSGAIGKLMNFDAFEGVEYFHQSHSFVRGNWGNEERSTFMLMSKSCHDMDIIAYLVGKPCERVSSFGSLSYVRKENAPEGAPARCIDGCPVEDKCSYSAVKYYLPDVGGWTWHAGFRGKTLEQKLELLRTGPYGRCVYQCDNDVVDHQVVSFEFAEGITGTFTMTAFDKGGRKIRLHGTEGTIYSDLDTIEVFRARDKAKQTIVIPPQSGGHGGGDDNVMSSLVHALRTNNPDAVRTGTAESLRTHKIAFAAEMARREKRVVEMSEI